jgi:hypothetical protein
MSTRIRIAHVAVLIASLTTAPPTHAATGRAARATAGKPKAPAAGAVHDGDTTATKGEDVVFDDIMVELNGDRLDAVLKGLDAARGASAGRADLVAEQQRFIAQEDSLRTAHGAEIDEAHEKHQAVVIQIEQGYRAVAAKHQAELKARGETDHAFRQETTILSMRLAQAQAKGDTTEANRLQAQIQAMSAPTSAESLAVRAKYGPPPPLHPLEAQLTSYGRHAREDTDAIQAMDARALRAATAASGLDENQFTKARERITTYLALARAKAPQHGFSTEELIALRAHRAALDAALGIP